MYEIAPNVGYVGKGGSLSHPPQTNLPLVNVLYCLGSLRWFRGFSCRGRKGPSWAYGRRSVWGHPSPSPYRDLANSNDRGMLQKDV